MHWGFYVTAGLVGLLIGSFLNVVIYRGPSAWGLLDDSDSDSPRGDLIRPRSYCPACGAQISAVHLVPLLGFALAKGKCVKCNAQIGLRYPIVELLGAAMAVSALVIFGLSIEALLAALFGWTLIALSFIDLDTTLLPDVLTIPLIAGGIAFNTVDLFTPWPDAIIGAIAGYGVFWLIEVIYRKLRDRDGLGRGDAKLLSAIGAWAGWQALPIAVLIGAVGTLAIIGLNRLRGGNVSADMAIPFGPGLAVGGFVVLMSGF